MGSDLQKISSFWKLIMFEIIQILSLFKHPSSAFVSWFIDLILFFELLFNFSIYRSWVPFLLFIESRCFWTGYFSSISWLYCLWDLWYVYFWSFVLFFTQFWYIVSMTLDVKIVLVFYRNCSYTLISGIFNTASVGLISRPIPNSFNKLDLAIFIF